MKKVLFIDIDGVIILGRKSDNKIWTTDLKNDLGIDPNLLTHYLFNEEFLRCQEGYTDLYDLVNKSLSFNNQAHLTEQLVEYWFDQDMGINNELINQLSHIHSTGKVEIVLISNQERHRAKYLRKYINFNDFSSATIMSCDIGYTKPRSEFYDIVSKKHNINNSTVVLFIDDDDKNFINGIQEWKCFKYTTYHALKKWIDSQGIEIL